MDKAVTIRQMVFTDLQDILNIEGAVHPTPWTQQIFIDCLKVGYFCKTICVDTLMIGYAVGSQAVDDYHILNLSIDPRWQRRGYGNYFLKYLLAQAQEKKAARILLEVRVSNLPAIHLYKKHGFAQLSMRKNYYQTKTGREDAIVMALDFCQD